MNLTCIRARMYGVLLALILPAGVAALAPMSAASQTLQIPEFREGNRVLRVLEAPKPVPKTSFAFKASELFFAGATAFDMTTTVRSLDHPTIALRSDGTPIAHYDGVEKGWAGIFGRRDPYTAVAANVILNAGIDRFSRRLYTRGGRWRALSYGMVLSKGALNMLAGAGNIRHDSRIDAQVRLATGYQGAITWVH